jgi:hypothetical protein
MLSCTEGWAHELPPETIELLLNTYLARDPEEDELDAVMSLLSFWIGAGNSATHELRSLGQALIGRAAVLERDRVGLDYVRNALSSQLGIDADVRLDVLLQALKRVQHPSAEDIVTLGDLAETEPSKVVPTVIEFLLSDEEGWSLYLQSSHFLTLLGQRAGAHFVAGEIRSLALEKQIRLLSHIDFTSEDPDPIFVKLFELSGNEQEFQEAAASRYLFPGEVVSGSYSHYLERRKEQAIRWAEVHPVLEEWAASVASSIDSWIENERLQEEERGY